MTWKINFYSEFAGEFAHYSEAVKNELFAYIEILQAEGSNLGRPHVDTLNGSEHANMKEIRFKADNGVWRVAFAFDPKREGILLIAGDKSGVSQKRFYKRLIKKADTRFNQHLEELKGE